MILNTSAQRDIETIEDIKYSNLKKKKSSPDEHIIENKKIYFTN